MLGIKIESTVCWRSGASDGPMTDRPWTKALLWAALVVPLVIGVLTIEDPVYRWVELVLGALLLGAAVLLFDTYPMVTLSLTIAATTVQLLVLAPTATNPKHSWPFFAAAVFGYLAGRRLGEARPIWYALVAVVLAGLPVSVLLETTARGGFGLVFGLYDWFVLVLLLLPVVVLPWLFGRYRRQRAELVAAGWERAALLERQQQLEVERSRVRERARIARDMHDSLGHEWGLIALRAAALEVSAELGERPRALAGELRAGVSEATERLQEIIGMLGPGNGTEPDERVDITGLIERAAGAGMNVEWARPEIPADLPVIVDRAAHRVVQEGLTNARKHAAGRPVTVTVDGRPGDGLRIELTNAASNGTSLTPGSGTGLVGLTERVQLAGGTLDHGQVPGGGFRLEASLPWPV